MSKFAPITSGLLARKGEAGPSAVPGMKLPFVWASAQFAPETGCEAEDWTRVAAANEEVSFGTQPAVAFKAASRAVHRPAQSRVPAEASGPVGHGPDNPREKPRKISVALSPREHETLGIVAVKRGLTRHQVVRNALDAYFETLAKEYRTQCNCIARGCSCAGECSAA